MFTIKDCHFGLSDNYETDLDDCTVAIMLSALGSCGLWVEDVEEGDIEGFPDWLVGRNEAECFYAAPVGWSLAKTKQELEAIGFTHNPRWDNEYGA